MRILLVDDHRLLLEALSNLLTANGITVVGQAHDGVAAVALARALRPEIVLMDIRMPGGDGLTATRRIKAELPATRIVILTTSTDEVDLFEAVKSGACGYLLKSMGADELIDSLAGAQQGVPPFSPGLAEKLLVEFSRLAGSATPENTATPPAVTVEQAINQPDPAAVGPIRFTVLFTEPVSDFTSEDVTLSSTAGATTAVVTNLHDHMEYDVAVSGMTGSGTVIATVAANVASDAAGNGNAASTSTDNSVTYKQELIYITTTSPNGTAHNPNGTTVAYTKGDILKWNGQVWSKWFSSTAKGLPAGTDIYAFDVANEAAGSVWLTLGSDQKKVPGLGRVTAHEIMYFNGQSFSRFFDGGDVGLKTTGERINGLEVLPGSISPIGSGCLHYLLISTVAGGGVPVGNGNVNFTGEDVLGFCMTSVGANTAGQWHLVFEGQSHGLQKNNNRGLSANANATTLYFTAKLPFQGIPAGVVFSWNGSSFSGALWRATDHGVTRAVDGIDVVELGVTN